MQRVVVTGLGVITPIGLDKESFWKSLQEGRSGIRRLTTFDPTGFSSQVSGEVQGFDPEPFLNKKQIRRMDMFTQFAVAASDMALQDSQIDLNKEDPTRFGVMVGSGIGGLNTIEQQVRRYEHHGPSKISPFLIPMLITNIAGGEVAIKFGLKGPNFCIVSACATGAHSIGEAFRMIQRGDADLFLAGGTESAITELGFGSFCAMRAMSTSFNDEPERASRPFDRDRDGFVMAEGAGVLVLEELEHALKRNAPIYAEMAGYGLSDDAHHITAPAPGGEGGARSMTMALKDAKLVPEDVDYINAHGTSTQMNDYSETQAIKSVFKDHAYKLAISSTKSMTGHTLGAAGGIEAAAMALMIKHELIAPTINLDTPDERCDLDYVPNEARAQKINCTLSNSFGFGGHNASFILKRFDG